MKKTLIVFIAAVILPIVVFIYFNFLDIKLRIFNDFPVSLVKLVGDEKIEKIDRVGEFHSDGSYVMVDDNAKVDFVKQALSQVVIKKKLSKEEKKTGNTKYISLYNGTNMLLSIGMDYFTINGVAFELESGQENLDSMIPLFE